MITDDPYKCPNCGLENCHDWRSTGGEIDEKGHSTYWFYCLSCKVRIYVKPKWEVSFTH